MNIVLVIGSLQAGGAERQVVNLANQWVKNRECSIFIAQLDGSKEPAYDLDRKVNLVSLGAGGIIGLGKAIWRLRQLARNAQVLYSFLDIANIAATIASFRLETKLVYGARSAGTSTQWSSKLAHNIGAILSHRAALLIGNSEEVLTHYSDSHYRPTAIAMIPNGIDTQAFRPNLVNRRNLRNALGINDSIVIGYVARAALLKRHDLAIAAAAHVHKKYPVHLVLVGIEEPEMARIKGLVDTHQAQNFTTILPKRRDIQEMTGAFDICINTADYEGMPNNVLEAMACAVPCVTTDTGGSAQLLNGIGLTSRRGDLAGLVGNLELICTDAAKREELGKRCYERVVEQYSMLECAKQTMSAITRHATPEASPN